MATDTVHSPYSELEQRETPAYAKRERAREANVARAPAAAGAQLSGMLWFAGWLFTIAFAKLVWWKALLALVVWPFFLGETVR